MINHHVCCNKMCISQWNSFTKAHQMWASKWFHQACCIEAPKAERNAKAINCVALVLSTWEDSHAYRAASVLGYPDRGCLG